MNLSESQLRQIIREALQSKPLPAGWRVIIDHGDSNDHAYSFMVIIKNETGRLIGEIGADRHWSDNRCMYGVYEVEGSEASGGYGPTMYDIAIEFATMNGAGLMADRDSVSRDAERVWTKYLKMRDDVVAHNLPNNMCIGEEGDLGAGEWYYHRYTKDEKLIPMLARSGQLKVIFDGEEDDIESYY